MINLAVINQKGGVGKTTTAVTLAHLWASGGVKTLLIDLDPQGNVADCLGMEAGNETVQLLMPGVNLFRPAEARKNLDVLRMDKSGASLKIALTGEVQREYALARMLDDYTMIYDICVMDCAPSLDLLHICAICASDSILIPTKLDQLSVKGVKDVLESITNLWRVISSETRIAGILPTFFDRTTTETLLQLNNLIEHFGALVIPPIPIDTRMREATRHGQTILEYDPGSRSLNGYPEHKCGYKEARVSLENYIWA